MIQALRRVPPRLPHRCMMQVLMENVRVSAFNKGRQPPAPAKQERGCNTHHLSQTSRISPRQFKLTSNCSSAQEQQQQRGVGDHVRATLDFSLEGVSAVPGQGKKVLGDPGHILPFPARLSNGVSPSCSGPFPSSLQQKPRGKSPLASIASPVQTLADLQARRPRCLDCNCVPVDVDAPPARPG